MKLPVAVAAILAAVGSAADIPGLPPGSKPFELMSLRSASPIHFGPVSASLSSIFVNLPQQRAVCNGKDPNRAIFYIKDEELFLYTGSNPVQRIFVDRSGMGQGKMGYLTGTGEIPPHFEVKGWTIEKPGELYFKGKNLLACPNSIEHSWTVWVATDVLHPGGHIDCLGFIPYVIEITDPVPCKYS